MESPSPKRRRTSPHASIPVNASNTDLRAVSDDSNPQVFRQPSYMTPTKASLARFHPRLATKPSQSATPRSKGRLLLDQRSSRLKGSLRSPTKVLKSSRPDSIANAASLDSVAHALIDLPDGGLGHAKELTHTRTHVPQSKSSPSSTSRPTQDIEDQEPRASPPPEAAGEAGSVPPIEQDHDEVVPGISQGSPQSKDSDLQAEASAQCPHLEPNSQSIEPQPKISTTTVHVEKSDDDLVAISTPTRHRAAEDDEPKLPSTPRQLGLEPPASKPTGILSISPSRNGKRRRAPSTKSSPLKPMNADLVKYVVETAFERSLGPRPDLALASDEAAPALRPLENRLERDSALSIMPTYATSKLLETDPLYNIQDTVSLNITVSDVVSRKGGHSSTFRDVVLHSPSDILITEIRMFLKDSGKVASIAVMALTSWASELVKWLKAPIADRTQDAIVRAVGRFWDMAEIRGFCWYKCQHESVHLFDDTGHVSTEKVSDVPDPPSNGNGVELAIKGHIEKPEPSSVSDALSLEKLYHCMRLNSICLRDSAVRLEVTWAVNFTPSGKVTSRVSAHASFPKSWEEDEGDLKRTDEAFKRLVQSGKPVYEAVRCIVEAMFPDSRG